MIAGWRICYPFWWPLSLLLSFFSPLSSPRVVVVVVVITNEIKKANFWVEPKNNAITYHNQSIRISEDFPWFIEFVWVVLSSLDESAKPVIRISFHIISFDSLKYRITQKYTVHRLIHYGKLLLSFAVVVVIVIVVKLNWTLTADFFTSLQSLPAVWVGGVRSFFLFYLLFLLYFFSLRYFVCNFFLFCFAEKRRWCLRKMKYTKHNYVCLRSFAWESETRSIKIGDDPRYFDSEAYKFGMAWKYSVLARALWNIHRIHFSCVHSYTYLNTQLLDAFKPNYRCLFILFSF